MLIQLNDRCLVLSSVLGPRIVIEVIYSFYKYTRPKAATCIAMRINLFSTSCSHRGTIHALSRQPSHIVMRCWRIEMMELLPISTASIDCQSKAGCVYCKHELCYAEINSS